MQARLSKWPAGSYSLTVIMHHISQTGIQSLGDVLTGLLCDRAACLIQVCGLRKAFPSRYFQNGLPGCVETALWKRQASEGGLDGAGLRAAEKGRSRAAQGGAPGRRAGKGLSQGGRLGVMPGLGNVGLSVCVSFQENVFRQS